MLRPYGELGSRGFRARFRQSPVQLWPPVAQEVHLVLARLEDAVLPIAALKVKIGRQHRLAIGRRLGQDLAVRSDNEAAAEESMTALFTDAIGGQEEDAVLDGARPRQIVWIEGRRGWPGGRQQDDLSAVERQGPHRLGEAQVVADENAEPGRRRRHHRKELGAARQIAVDAQAQQMGLAVDAEDSLGADQQRRIVQHHAGPAFDQAHGRDQTVAPARLLQVITGGAGYRLGDGLSFGARKKVPGDDALGKDRQAGAGLGCLLQPGFDAAEVLAGP